MSGAYETDLSRQGTTSTLGDPFYLESRYALGRTPSPDRFPSDVRPASAASSLAAEEFAAPQLQAEMLAARPHFLRTSLGALPSPELVSAPAAAAADTSVGHQLWAALQSALNDDAGPLETMCRARPAGL